MIPVGLPGNGHISLDGSRKSTLPGLAGWRSISSLLMLSKNHTERVGGWQGWIGAWALMMEVVGGLGRDGVGGLDPRGAPAAVAARIAELPQSSRWSRTRGGRSDPAGGKRLGDGSDQGQCTVGTAEGTARAETTTLFRCEGSVRGRLGFLRGHGGVMQSSEWIVPRRSCRITLSRPIVR